LSFYSEICFMSLRFMRFFSPLIFLAYLITRATSMAEAQENKPAPPKTKDELFARYLSDTLNAPGKINELLSFLGKRNTENDQALVLDEFEVAFELAPYAGDSVPVLTKLYSMFSGMLFNAGAKEMGIEYAKTALVYRQKKSEANNSWEYNLIGKIGSFYLNARKYDSSMRYYRMAEKTAWDNGRPLLKSASLNNLGMLLMAEGKYDSASKTYEKARQVLHPLGNKEDSTFLGAIYDNMAYNLLQSKKYPEALVAYKNKLNWSNQIHAAIGAVVSEIGIARCLIGMHNNKDALSYLKQAESDPASQIKKKNHSLIMELLQIKENYDSATGNWKNTLILKNEIGHIYDSISSDQQKTVDGLMRTVTEKEILKSRRDIQYYQLQQAQKMITLKEEEKRKEQKAAIIRNVLIAGLILCLIFAIVFFMQRVRISNEKKRSEELLLNILPAETANELLEKGSIQAKDYEMVTVLFTDFENFTQSSENMKAQDLVNEIHYCYSEFDRIIAKHGIEKIKTIGDGYMAAGGLPVKNHTNPVDAVNAALEIRDFMKREKEKRLASGKTIFETRIGLHTGSVVAGIVGIKKFAYDIWGDTVNIAARMESSGAAGKVNISGATYELVKHKFKCIHRGKVKAKNKGEIDMYFVES
jgi:class 3 adenylate cyclase/Tfp pilus assembly protein PilF